MTVLDKLFHIAKSGIKLLLRALGINQKISPAERQRLHDIEQVFPEVLSTTETLQRIIKEGASICRFGDAEFGIATAEQRDDPYQRPSAQLTERLFTILETPSSKKRIIAIPPFNAKYNNLPRYYKDISFWEWYWLTRFEKLSAHFKHPPYGNSFVSRDAVFYENELEEVKKIWDGREVVFVTGKGSRFIFDERVFGNIVQKYDMYVSPTNAFDEYDRILAEALQHPKERLFLIAAGPTATVLAFDLSEAGYQAIDIGHISNCYRQFLGEDGSPESKPMIAK
jgi:glycosyltransferase family protein